MLIATMLLAQVIINVAVINVRLLSPGDPAVAGALLAALVLARAPLFVFTSLQTALLPGLAGAVAAGDQPRFRVLLGRGCAIVTILGAAGGLPAVIFGPWLTRVLFGARPVLGDPGFAWLAAGTLCYMLALVLGQGAIALSRHRDQLLSWMRGRGARRRHRAARRGDDARRGRLRAWLRRRGRRAGDRADPARAEAGAGRGAAQRRHILAGALTPE